MYNRKLLFTAWWVLVYNTNIIRTEPLTREVLACDNDALYLHCDDNQVVAAEIYTVRNHCWTSDSGDECSCDTASRDCLMIPLLSVSEINKCRWKKSTCEVKTGVFQPCIVAKQFHCVQRGDIVDICSHGADLTKPSGYITSPGYPSAFRANLNCSVTIRIPSGKSIYIRMISSHMPQRCATRDYLTISTDRGHVTMFCGDVSYDENKTWIVPGSHVTLNFVSREMAKSYQGLVLYYEFVEELHTLNPTDARTNTLSTYVVILNSASPMVGQPGLMFAIIMFVLNYS